MEVESLDRSRHRIRRLRARTDPQEFTTDNRKRPKESRPGVKSRSTLDGSANGEQVDEMQKVFNRPQINANRKEGRRNRKPKYECIYFFWEANGKSTPDPSPGGYLCIQVGWYKLVFGSYSRRDVKTTRRLSSTRRKWWGPFPSPYEVQPETLPVSVPWLVVKIRVTVDGGQVTKSLSRRSHHGVPTSVPGSLFRLPPKVEVTLVSVQRKQTKDAP